MIRHLTGLVLGLALIPGIALAQQTVPGTQPLLPRTWVTKDGNNVLIPSGTSYCQVASINPAGVVTVDWGCAERSATEVVEGREATVGSAMAAILIAVRDGKAKSK